MKRYLFVSHGATLNGAERCLVESVVAFKKNEFCETIVLVPGEIGPAGVRGKDQNCQIA